MRGIVCLFVLASLCGCYGSNGSSGTIYDIVREGREKRGKANARLWADSHPDASQEELQRIENRVVKVGDTMEFVKVAWGVAPRRSTVVQGDIVIDHWHWSDGYIRFENNVVTTARKDASMLDGVGSSPKVGR